MSNNPRPPRELGKAGRAFWRDMVIELEFGPHELRILRDAAATVDTIAALEEATRAEGFSVRVRGSMGQPTIAPEVAEIRVQRALLASLIARLKVPALDDATADDHPSNVLDFFRVAR